MENASVLKSKDCSKAVTKNIVLLLSGQLVSMLESSIYSFSISLYILQITGSALNFSITLALGTLPRVLFGPVAGVVADRFDRKKMVVSIDLLSGVIVLVLLGISFADQLRLPYLYATTFLLSTCSVFFNTPLQASIKNLVDEKNLMRINSLSSTISSLTAIAGPFIGGLVFAVMDIKLFFLINGLSFLFSGIAEAFVDFDLKEKIEGILPNKKIKESFNFVKDMKEGIQYIMKQKWLMVLGSFVILFNMLIMIGLTVPIPFIVREEWGFGAQQLGMINMMFPLGMLIGSLGLSIVPQSERLFKRLIGSIAVFSLAILVAGLVSAELFFKGNSIHNIAILMGMYLTMAIASVLINLPIGVAMQKLVPNEMMGRVQGTLGTLATGLTPIGAIIGGVLVDRLYPPIIPISCGAIMLALTFAMGRVAELKEI